MYCPITNSVQILDILEIRMLFILGFTVNILLPSKLKKKSTDKKSLEVSNFQDSNLEFLFCQ